MIGGSIGRRTIGARYCETDVVGRSRKTHGTERFKEYFIGDLLIKWTCQVRGGVRSLETCIVRTARRARPAEGL